MADFLPAFERVLLEEGGYKLTNSPNDRGGMTYAGISRKFHPDWLGWRYIDAGGEPPAQLVRDFYETAFWLPIRGGNINDQRVAEALYSMSVNAEAARKLAQIVLNVTPDGKFGTKTLAALNAMDAERFLDKLCIAAIARYRDICVRDKTQRQWLVGWLNRALKVAA